MLSRTIGGAEPRDQMVLKASHTQSGNSAGVVVGAEALGDGDVLDIAARLGFSETAFLTSIAQESARVRYFTPHAEIASCGHATIASGVALARRGAGPVVHLATNAGEVPVEVAPHQATTVAVHTTIEPLDDDVLDELLQALQLERADLDPPLGPALAHGGNPHPTVPMHNGVLTHLDHDADAVLQLHERQRRDGTIAVVHRTNTARFASCNPFPRGGIREDPATGSAGQNSARTHGQARTSRCAETGRTSLIKVAVPDDGRVRITAAAERFTSMSHATEPSARSRLREASCLPVTENCQGAPSPCDSGP